MLLLVKHRIATAVLVWLGTVSYLAGQVTTSSLSGQVFDPSGRPANHMQVEVADAAHSVIRTTMTDSTGFYRFLALPPATYSVAVRGEGFAPVSRKAPLSVNSQMRLDFHVTLEPRREVVDVGAEAQALDVRSSEVAAVLDRERIASLPLNRRDFLQLALLSPGVAPPVEDSELSSRGAFAMHANGGREEHNNFLLDGADNNDPYVNRYVLQPSVDTIQEFKIAVNSYSAEYGRSAGGQVNVITRRGTNAFHGFLYEYLRNRHLDARNFFNSQDKPKFVRNQAGFGLGGPIIPGRTFFFASTDLLRERRGLSRLATVPSPAERRGDLSGSGRIILDPFTRTPFPGSVLPSSRISPVGGRVADLFPLPNLAGASGNYLGQPVLRDDQSQGSIRLDHQVTQKDEISMRYSFGLVDLFEPYAEDTDAVPGFGNFVEDPAHHAMVHYQRMPGPRSTNSLRLSFSRFSRQILPENHRVDVAAQLGVGWLHPGWRDSGYPSLSVAGFSRLGDATSLPIFRHANSWQIIDGFAYSRGAHLIKLGGEVRHIRLNSSLDLLTRGSLSFSGLLSGAGITDLLMGFPSFGIQAVADNPQTLRTNAYNTYVQDDWRLTPGLTLNLGLRYELNTPPTDPTDRMSTLDFRAGRVVRVGTGEVPRAAIRPDRNNFAPRIGLAWNLANRLMVRGGYGVYFDSGMLVVNSAQYFNPPQFNLRVFFPTATSLLTLTNPFPLAGGVVPPSSLNILSPDLSGAYLQHWNLSLQRTWNPVGALSLAYAGSAGAHLIRSRNLNQPLPGPGDVQTRRPNPSFGGIFFVESAANSNYHSLQATLDRPLTHNLSLWAVYSFAKSIDDTSAFLGTKADKNFPQDSFNYRAERGPSSFDVTHRFVVAHIYVLPRHWRWAGNTELRGITTVQGGQPFTPILRFDNSNTGNTGGTFGSDRPDMRGDPRLTQPGPDRWFDAGAFRTPARYSFGSAGRNVVRGPGLFTLDLSLARRFALRRESSLAAEVQFFNSLNRANLNLPELYADEPTTFGRIFASKGSRQLQFVLRLSF